MSEIQPVPNALLGIDVSHYQGVIDWPKVAANGVKFAFIKATDGETLTDELLASNVACARNAGIAYGLYHFWRPQDDGGKQLDKFLNATNGMLTGLPPALDIETGALTEENQGSALAWLAGVKLQGFNPIVYVSPSYARFNLTDPAWIQYPLWSAHYTELLQPNTDKWPTWMFWQRQGNGSVPGISTPVDIDWFNGPQEDLQKLIALPT